MQLLFALALIAGSPTEASSLGSPLPGTELQTVNHGDEELLVYAYGTPPESEHAEILDSAI